MDGEAIQQEEDDCYGVVRCHGFFQPERSEHPMKSIAAKRLPSSRFIEQQDAKTFDQQTIADRLILYQQEVPDRASLGDAATR